MTAFSWPAFFGKLASDVSHTHTVVSEIRADLRDTNRRLDRIHDRLDVIGNKSSTVASEIAKRLDEIDAELERRLTGVRS
jgi:tetrahydromethanopterin S-methyltransferase subunit G